LAKYVFTLKYLALNAIQVRYPLYASFKVTMRCMYTCEFCNCWQAPKKDLTTEQCIQILQNLGRSSVLLVSFEGGDPLMRNDIIQLLQEAHRQPFYTMFTTSQKNLLSYDWHTLHKYIDFLEISIDEGHNNLHFFDMLTQINAYDMSVCVQTVVRKEDIAAMEQKVVKARAAGVKLLFMPAVSLEHAVNKYPHFATFATEVLRLKTKYPLTIITPNAYFKNVQKSPGGCAPNSILIDGDGSLIYPCRTLEQKTIKLYQEDLMAYLNSQDAVNKRQQMSACTKQCGWYQHFATSSFTNPLAFWDAIKPYVKDFVGHFLKSYQ
jgi:MoaA/NifB/PqqE/SkfB family radical SAM enzyme